MPWRSYWTRQSISPLSSEPCFLLVHPSLQTFVLWLNRIRFLQQSILLVSVVYVFVIFGGGYFIRAPHRPSLEGRAGANKKEHEEVINAGLYIGWLERFLVLTAVFLQISRHRRLHSYCEIDCALSGAQVRPLRGIFSDWGHSSVSLSPSAEPLSYSKLSMAALLSENKS